MIPKIGLFDWSLALMYLFIIYFFAVLYKRKKIKTNPEYQYFLIGLTAKLIGGIGFVLFSVYWYKGGDTFVFFNAGKGLTEYFFTDFSAALEVLVTSADNLNLDQHNFASAYNYILKSDDVLAIVKIMSVVNMISFNSYLISSIVFASFSFFGLWFGYSNLCKLYPKSAKKMLVAFFCIPTALLWSSGILKDTVTIGVIGLFLYAFSNLFIFKRRIVTSLVMIGVGAFVLFLLKPYILYVLVPCLFIWVQSSFKNIVQNNFIRAIIKPIFILSLVGVGYFTLEKVSGEAGKYGVENIEQTLIGFHSWHEYLAENRDQSGYTLGEMEITPLGILKKVPGALNVTFFRPYLWEARNLPAFLGAIEGLCLFVYFMYLLMTIRFTFFRIILKNKEVFFMMLFAVVFGVVVGISSYNYGALSRYKIPAVMFFVLSLVLIQAESKKEKLGS